MAICLAHQVVEYPLATKAEAALAEACQYLVLQGLTHTRGLSVPSDTQTAAGRKDTAGGGRLEGLSPLLLNAKRHGCPDWCTRNPQGQGPQWCTWWQAALSC